MKNTLWGPVFVLCGLWVFAGCDDDPRIRRDGSVDGGEDTATDTPRTDAPWNPDAACAIATSEAEVANRPVDIIWMVDNSSSMEPAIREVQSGLNDFANRVASGGLDYRVIMLSLRGTGGGDRFPVCIPPPLAGDGSCGNGSQFFHVDVDIRSTQLIEQFLGTLAQTEGFAEGDSRGSIPWRDLLRLDSTKTIVIATDDNQRTCDRPCPGCMCQGGDPQLTPTSLEDFPGGGDPFNGNQLGPGILTDEYDPLFVGYTFNGIYGWGSAGDPDVLCTYPDSSEPSAAGHTYTALVERTGGVRAQICDQADSATWDSFFEAVATTVEETARIDCEIPLPPPPDGMMLDPAKVNVLFTASDETVPIFKVPGAADCGSISGGWYYDDNSEPTAVILCDSSCEDAQRELSDTGSAGISVAFGCDTLLI